MVIHYGKEVYFGVKKTSIIEIENLYQPLQKQLIEMQHTCTIYANK